MVDNEPRPGTCVTCPAIRPDSAARLPHNPPVCDGDRTLINRWLGEIAGLVADLTNDEPAIIDDRQHERFGTVYFEGGVRHTFSRGLKPSDPVAVLGGVAPINSRSAQPSVSGYRERPIPINATAVDLTAGRRVHNLTGQSWPDDQVGYLSAATVLDEWVRDVRDRLQPDHHLPEPTVDGMVMWLRVRLDIVCDQHPEVAVFAEGLRMLRGALRAAAGETEPKPERCEQVPCRQCDLEMLFKQPGGDVQCLNPDCQAVLREDEYRDWVKTVLAARRIEQTQHA